MAEFNGQFITNKGRNLLNRALAGEGKIIFTGAALGVGKHTEHLKEITDLKDKKLDMNVLSVRNDNGSAVLKLFVTNEKVKESFTTQEFGVYAKIEGDSTPILYSYATAIEPDTIPSNKFGTTYEAINEIYMSFVSDIDTDIQVTHGNIFMTLEIASEIFLKHGYVLGGKLKEQTQLLKDRVYSTDTNEHYLNTETRAWDQVEKIDDKLVKLTYKDLLKFSSSNISKEIDTLTEKVNNALSIAKSKEDAITKNTAFNKNFGTTTGTVLEGDKYPIIEKKFKGIAGNDINPGFIQDPGQKVKGKFYLDKNTGKLYRCVNNTNSTTNSTDNFQDVSLDAISDKLDNLFKLNRIMNQKTSTGKLPLIDNYTKYKFLIFYSELDGNDGQIAHTYMMPVNTNFQYQMVSINQWGSPNTNAIELILNSTNGLIEVANSLGGAIIAIDAIF